MTRAFANECVWLLGASSGIGAALAQELAAQGAQLVLSGRRATNLHDLRAGLPGTGHDVVPLDVTDAAALSAAVAALSERHQRVHRVIFLAADYMPGTVMDVPASVLQRIVTTNLTAAFMLTQAVVPWLARSGGGQLVFTASVAGYRGLPGGQPYSATKAALINLAETLRTELAPLGIDVRVVNPGFVRSPLTQRNTFPMPMLMEAPDAARAFARGLRGSAFEIAFPRRFILLMKLLRIVPDRWFFALAARLRQRT